ncbi:MAG TPA: zf-HC2 domain-containing protein [Longimicrobiales bacterium]|nr:zf-HC2 domain-containing protein [Longimicrobiales bacterium]
MSHVDEGALHAYLDGALDEYPAATARRVREHLETCSTCRERLSEARMLRDEAARVLQLAAPPVGAPPPLEELRARVQAARPRRSPLGRLQRLGWAASVALALGAGWAIRGRGGEATDESPVEAVVAADPETDAEANAGSSDAGSSDAGRASGPAAEVVAEAPAGPRAPAARPAPEAAPPVPAEPAGRTAAAEAGDAAAAADLGVPEADGVDPSLLVARAPAVLPEPPRPSPLPLQPRSTAAAPGGATGELPAEPQATAAAADDDDGDPEPVLASARATGARPGLGRVPAGQRATEEERAGSAAASLSLVVPGLEVIAVLPVGEGTTFAGMRALQRLPGGDTLEVAHLPAGVHPSTLPPPSDGVVELTRERGDGWIVLRARRSEAELLALLQGLEAGG